MSATLLLAFLAAAAQGNPDIVYGLDPPQGPMAGENRTLSQWHRNADDRMFPDLAIKEMRLDGDTLHVLVANQGGYRADGPILVTARAVANGVNGVAQPARLGRLPAGQSRWVALRHFQLKSASAVRTGPIFVLGDANAIIASVRQSAPPAATLNRSGRSCETCREQNEANNSLTGVGGQLKRGRPD